MSCLKGFELRIEHASVWTRRRSKVLHTASQIFFTRFDSEDVPPSVHDELIFGLAARSDLQRFVSGMFEGHLKAHTKRLP